VNSNTCALAGVVVPADSKIKSVKELKGLTVAGQKGTSTDFTIKYYMLPKHGLSERDINWLSVRGPDVVATLVSGNAQAGHMIDPQAEIAVQKGLIRYLNDMAAKQMKLGWIKSHPDFAKIPVMDDSIMRKVAAAMGLKAN
jgi:sulfonate transport system substrate-binding protein